MRKRKDNYILKNKQGLYLSNIYRLTSNINHALVFIGKGEALWKANWLKDRYKDLVPVKIGLIES